MTDDQYANQPPRLADIPPRGIERDILNDMLQSLVRPNAAVEEIVAGPKFIAVIAGGRMGLASLLGARPTERESGLMKTLVGGAAGRAAESLLSPSPFAVCLGMAALNAANAPDPSAPSEDDRPADALIAGLGRDKCVGLVGEFPFTASLREQVGTLHLFELRDVPGAVPRDQWEHILPELDVLAVTGTALLTRQMGYFLSLAHRAVSVVLGPTTPLSPALFKYGADYLCGSVVTDLQLVSEGVRSGLPFKAIKKRGGIRFVTWENSEGRGVIQI